MAINQLQLPGGFNVPQVDFSSLASIGQDYRRKAALADLPKMPDGTVDYNAAAAKLLQSGDLEGARTFATLANTTALQKAQVGNMAFNQGIETRKVNLAERAAEEKPTYQTIEGPDGQKQIVKLEPYGRGASVVTPTGMNTTPNNPFASNGKMNETQSKDALYATRAYNAEKVLGEKKVIDAGASPTQRLLGAIPGVGNYLVGEDYQRYDQAQRDFINSILRRESGAVISEGEFANARRQYFPQPGDSQAVLEQKRQNRIAAISGIAAGAGQGYKPPFTLDAGSGRLVDRPAAPVAPPGAPAAGAAPPVAPAPAGAPAGQPAAPARPPGASAQQIVQEARAWLQRPGVTPEQKRAVIERLRAWGIAAPGLQ